MEELRIATFNASLNRLSEGQLIEDLSTPDNAQAQAVASIVQTVRPDIILINEFDFDADGEAADLFRDNYLEVSQEGRVPIDYPYVYLAPSNTGIASGFDLDNNGEIVTNPGEPGYGNDAFGFGEFPGQFAMVVYSMHPILEDAARTFQNFLWQDMPGALLPDDPATPEPADFYSPEELEVFRLSSKSHWDVPVEVDGEIVHILAAHPTPPVFDGEEDRNGLRNHDEIRLLADYVTPGEGGYIYDDKGDFGGLGAGERFVILGDMNADPFDGDSVEAAVQQLLGNPAIDVSISPVSEGGIEQSALQGLANDDHLGNPALDTADFNPAGPGNLRADYALPSNAGFELLDAGVFWPTEDDPDFDLVGTFPFPSSDHRLTYIDVETTSAEGVNDRTNVEGIEFLGAVTFETGFVFDGTEVGGLSALAYDEADGVYYALSDDRGSDASQPRFYELTIDLGDGALDEGDVVFTDVTTLTDGNGQPFEPGVLDAEGLAFSSRNFLYLSSEGDASQLFPPTVGAFSLEGEHFGQLDAPGKFDPSADGMSGIRNNLAFESLTLTPNEDDLITATENALLQDGPAASLDGESPSRVLVFDAETGLSIHEYIYEVEAIPNAAIPLDAFADNGLVELLALDNAGSFLALERSFAIGFGNTIRLFEASTQGATDVSGFDGILDPATGEPFDIDATVKKDLLLDFADLGLELDNYEALAFGPELADGRQSLIVASDNNFSDAQATKFLAFALDLGTIPAVEPVLETPDEVRFGGPELLDPTQERDPDDPAIWIDPDDAAHSTVISTNKNTGFRVYDLEGNELQSESPEDIRFNNVDLVYGFELGEEMVDLAVFSDRANDTLAIYTIDPASRLLSDVTSHDLAGPAFSVFGVDDGEQTAYALTTWTDPETHLTYAFTSQADGAQVAQLELMDSGDGTVGAEIVRVIDLPVPTGDPEDSQSEGLVVDRETGDLYVALENEVGILKFDADPEASSDFKLAASIDEPFLTADIEGLTIYYAADGAGYLIASSQGDNSYAVFDRAGDNDYLGSFVIGPGGDIDGAQETDGIDVTNLALNDTFEEGLFIVQDGSNESQTVFQDPEDGEIQNFNANFKLVPWSEISAAFVPNLLIDTESFNPREIAALDDFAG